MNVFIMGLFLLSLVCLTIVFVILSSNVNIARFMRVEMKNKNVLGLYRYLDEKIIQSNLQLSLPYYNVVIHSLLSITIAIVFTGVAFATLGVMSISAVVSLIGLILPTVGLHLLSEYMGYKTRKGSIDTVVALDAAYATQPDIFKAFEQIAPYAVEPIRTKILMMLGDYGLKISPVKCLDRFRKSLNYPDLQMLIKQIQIKYVEGGSIAPILRRYLDHVKRIDEDEEKERLEELTTVIYLYVFIFINFMSIDMVLSSSNRTMLLTTAWGKALLIGDILVSVVILVLSLKRH